MANLQLIGQITATAAPLIAGAYTSFKANNAAEKENRKKKRLKKLLRNLEASRQPLVNPYENLSVATKAAEMKIEQTDVALANTLDTLRATGAGAGGATALAQAAAQSKKEVASSIETQEAANEQLKAKGEAMVWQARETREMQKLDRTAGLLERAEGQKMQYKQDAMGAMMGGAMGAAQIASVMPWATKNKTKTVDPKNTIDPKSINNPQQVTSQYIPPINMAGVYNLGLGTAQTSIPRTDTDFINNPLISVDPFSNVNPQTGGMVPGITGNSNLQSWGVSEY